MDVGELFSIFVLSLRSMDLFRLEMIDTIKIDTNFEIFVKTDAMNDDEPGESDDEPSEKDVEPIVAFSLKTWNIDIISKPVKTCM